MIANAQVHIPKMNPKPIQAELGYHKEILREMDHKGVTQMHYGCGFYTRSNVVDSIKALRQQLAIATR